jgi:putative ABC transport system permease protein
MRYNTPAVTTSRREEAMMAHSTDTRPRQSNRTLFLPTVTLAAWRLRATWRLLLIAGAGMLVAVALICAVPLYTEVALTAGLRGVLTATPQDAELNVSAEARTLTTESVTDETQEFTALIRQNLGAYLTGTSEFFIQMPPLTDAALGQGNQMVLTGTALSQAAPHLALAQGRLPQAGSDVLELALTPGTAAALGLHVGDALTLLFQFPTMQGQLTEHLLFHVVGLFRPSQGDPFWHANTFEPVELGEFIDYPALMSSDALLATLTRLASQDQNSGGIVLTDSASLNWYYHLTSAHIQISQLDDLIAKIAITQTYMEGRAAGEAAYLTSLRFLGPAVEAFGAPSTLDRFRDRVSVIQVPITILALQIGALVLFFVSLMAELLVERQVETIALLRSRGASRRQILGSFVVQGLGVGALVLALGPWLAMGVAWVLAEGILPGASRGALNVLGGNPLTLVLGVGWYALIAAACASLTLIVTTRRVADYTVLVQRREVARDQRRPRWQRWYLDVVAALLALAGYGAALYVTQTGAADARVNLLISTPLALAAPIFLVLAGLLFLLRFFPVLVRRLARVASRRPAAAPVLALAQMARAPHKALRLVLLLGLTSSFAIFSLVFTATEPQQLANVAAHLVGADFSGTFSNSAATPSTLAQRTAAYRALPGVISATLGYANDVSIQGNTLALRAVDSSTFAQTAIWTDQDSSQSLAALMAELTSDQALASGRVPVIVDALAWERLHLAIGAQVLLPLEGKDSLALSVVAEVQHLPTVNDSLSGGTSDYTPPGGMLLDYRTLAGRAESLKHPLNMNAVWLRTSDNPTPLAGIRAALSSGPLQLENVQDRRLILADFRADPLYLSLPGVLSMGVIATLFLAGAGSLLASWLNARQRLTNFVVLRALGMAPRQVANVLLWEQGIIYAAALALGVVFGAVLAVTLVPALVFTGAPDAGNALPSGEFDVLQRVLPVQLVLPPSLLIVFASLVALSGGALWLMARVVSRPTLSQTLRLNED